MKGKHECEVCPEYTKYVEWARDCYPDPCEENQVIQRDGTCKNCPYGERRVG